MPIEKYVTKNCPDCNTEMFGRSKAAIRCVKCTKKHNNTHRASIASQIRQRLKAKGICVMCHEKPAKEGFKRCADCVHYPDRGVLCIECRNNKPFSQMALRCADCRDGKTGRKPRKLNCIDCGCSIEHLPYCTLRCKPCKKIKARTYWEAGNARRAAKRADRRNSEYF